MKNKKKLIITIAVSFTILCFACVMVMNLVVIPTNQYNQAVVLRNEGKDEEAYRIFSDLGDFKDSKDICNSYDYKEAISYLDNGHPETAFYLLNNILDYKEATTTSSELLVEYPYFNILNSAPGDEVVLGTYEQDNNTSNGPEEVEWIVLKNENGVVIAVSKYILDSQVYNTHNGDGSTLKGWLKDDFYNTAFSGMLNGFVRKVGLLTRDDMDSYDEIANTTPEWTAYAKAQEPENHYYAGYSWWLDGEYFHGYGSADVNMDVVIESGSYSKNVSPITGVNGVRPMIIIDYVFSDKDYYADDYDDINNAGVTTRPENNGSTGGSSSKCPNCGGSGVVKYYYGSSDLEAYLSGHDAYELGECPMCDGTGR